MFANGIRIPLALSLSQSVSPWHFVVRIQQWRCEWIVFYLCIFYITKTRRMYSVDLLCIVWWLLQLCSLCQCHCHRQFSVHKLKLFVRSVSILFSTVTIRCCVQSLALSEHTSHKNATIEYHYCIRGTSARVCVCVCVFHEPPQRDERMRDV